MNLEEKYNSVVTEEEVIPDQDMVVGGLRKLGIDFSTEEENNRVLQIDPEKFYIVFADDRLDRASVDVMVGYFKKGGILFLNRNDNARGYSLEDLKSMKDGLTTLINMLEKQNKVSYNRFDIIKGEP